jgi:ribosome biogenesis GTPase / thiamine phosphate phosphatase
MGSDPIFRVVASHGRHAVVEGPAEAAAAGQSTKQRWHAHFRGRQAEAVVGDEVRFVPGQGGEGVIEAVLARRNLLFRQDEQRTKRFAANLDRLLYLLAGTPPFSENQLARCLIAASEAGVPLSIVLNKADLPSAAAARERLAVYRAMGVELIELSLKHEREAARASLGPLLADKTTLLLGQSGMGKSTLVNLMVPDAEAQVGDISVALNAGRHTTTSTRWYWLDAQHEAALIDTPGFQAFGLHHIEASALAGLMPDIAAEASHCRFSNCSHRHEPGCGVQAAVQAGRIDAQRYRLYAEFHEELSQAPRW